MSSLKPKEQKEQGEISNQGKRKQRSASNVSAKIRLISLTAARLSRTIRAIEAFIEKVASPPLRFSRLIIIIVGSLIAIVVGFIFQRTSSDRKDKSSRILE